MRYKHIESERSRTHHIELTMAVSARLRADIGKIIPYYACPGVELFTLVYGKRLSNTIRIRMFTSGTSRLLQAEVCLY